MRELQNVRKQHVEQEDYMLQLPRLSRKLPCSTFLLNSPTVKCERMRGKVAIHGHGFHSVCPDRSGGTLTLHRICMCDLSVSHAQPSPLCSAAAVVASLPSVSLHFHFQNKQSPYSEAFCNPSLFYCIHINQRGVSGGRQWEMTVFMEWVFGWRLVDVSSSRFQGCVKHEKERLCCPFSAACSLYLQPRLH